MKCRKQKDQLQIAKLVYQPTDGNGSEHFLHYAAQQYH